MLHPCLVTVALLCASKKAGWPASTAQDSRSDCFHSTEMEYHSLLTYRSSLDAQSVVVELENFDGVEGRAGEEGDDGLHPSRTKSIITEIQLSQACLCPHDTFT